MVTTEAYGQFALVTPSDTVHLTYHGEIRKSKKIMIGGSGTLAVKDDQGTAVKLTGLAVGVWHPIETDFVMNTDTTATNIAAMF